MDETQLAKMTVEAIGPALPYLLNKTGDVAATEAIKRLGTSAWEGAKAVWSCLWPKVQAKEAAREAATDAADNPDDDALASLRRQLTKILSDDPAFAQGLAALLKEATQTNVAAIATGDKAIAIGGDATGATIISGSHNTLHGK